MRTILNGAIILMILAQIEIGQVLGQSSDSTMSYLALGDSYTIGESVEEAFRWPLQLRDSLKKEGFYLDEPRIIARTGWRTDEMLDAATDQVSNDTFDIVSLLIGVNNEYQGRSPESFVSEFESCLIFAIDHSKRGKDGVFVLSIPDYGFTPFGQKNQVRITERLNKYNEICRSISEKHGVLFINITDISREVPENKELVAKDDLHPSGLQYAKWVERSLESVVELLEGQTK